jgi:putative protease
LEAGADAVYAGLDRFSARTYAENFSLPELKGLIDESHRAGVKVYLAFNALIKESELASAFRTLVAAAEAGPDAFIVQDLGLAALARRHCPETPLHASTLTAVHGLDGLQALRRLGFSRAVLPRELSLKEIARLTAASPIPTEIFVNGALCFSFSGLCLMSSFLGGRSALRGGCTQPCRRLYANAGRRRTFFSPSDFMAPPFLDELRRLPIAAFKIEGRMKGPDYVKAVISAYRTLLDADDFAAALETAEALLAQVPSRPTSAGFLPGAPLAPNPQNASGLLLGRLAPAGPGLGRLKLAAPLRLLDRLRLAAGAGEEGTSFKLRRMWVNGLEAELAEAGETAVIGWREADEPPPAGLLYKTGSGALEKRLLSSGPAKRLKKLAESFEPPRPVPTPPELRRPGRLPLAAPRSQPLWFWLDGPARLAELAKLRPRKIILPVTADNVMEALRLKKRLPSAQALTWSCPPLSFGSGREKLRRTAAKLVDAGFRDFLIANLGHVEMLQALRPDLRLWGDHRLGVLNRLTAEALRGLGLSGVTASLEADQESLLRLVQAGYDGGLLFYLYGRPPLFTARFGPLDLKRGAVVSPRGEKFWPAEEGGAFILQSERRLFLGGLLKLPKPPGFAGLLVDLRREPDALDAARLVKQAVERGRGSPGFAFNLKRGLR